VEALNLRQHNHLVFWREGYHSRFFGVSVNTIGTAGISGLAHQSATNGGLAAVAGGLDQRVEVYRFANQDLTRWRFLSIL